MRQPALHQARGTTNIDLEVRHTDRTQPGRGKTMAWKTPKFVEISVGMEINCYACADLAE